MVVCQGDGINLPLSITPSDANVQIAWSPTPSLDNPFTANPLARPTSNTTYTGTITNLDNFCQTSVTVPVTVIRPWISVPAMITAMPPSAMILRHPPNTALSKNSKSGNSSITKTFPKMPSLGFPATGDDEDQYPDEDGLLAIRDIQHRKITSNWLFPTYSTTLLRLLT
jgi:hypothetical protein